MSRNRVVVLVRQATQPGGIGSFESILGGLKSLKIRAQISCLSFHPKRRQRPRQRLGPRERFPSYHYRLCVFAADAAEGRSVTVYVLYV